jgi:cysteinyl-tRNA synthetase
MALHYLGEAFDIHMGGEDLIFPHHENEIAQSEAATGKEFARFWIHNGWVTLGGEKMAKSTGHYFLIEDVLKDYRPNVIRLYLLKTHYRNQIDFSKDRLDEAKSAYLRIQTYIHGFKELPKDIKPLMFNEFTDAMNDDLNTPKALAIIYDLINKGYEEESADIAVSVLRYLDILGFKEEIPAEPYEDVMNILREVKKKLKTEKGDDLLEVVKSDFIDMLDNTKDVTDIFPLLVNLLLRTRNRLRKDKNYEFADYIRKRLIESGIQIYDKGIDASTYRVEAT